MLVFSFGHLKKEKKKIDLLNMYFRDPYIVSTDP